MGRMRIYSDEERKERSCNIMLGISKDNVDILRYAIQYLEEGA
jgi:hypothetical protein